MGIVGARARPVAVLICGGYPLFHAVVRGMPWVWAIAATLLFAAAGYFVALRLLRQAGLPNHAKVAQLDAARLKR